MKIGHICLAPAESETYEHFAALVEAIAATQIDAEQHVLVANVALARRLASCRGVSVGPVVTTAVMAYCLMPNVEIAHVHESKSGQAGLLLTLTRSIPFVITTKNGETSDMSPVARSVRQRAVRTIKCAETASDERSVRNHMNVYADALS